LGGGGHWVDFIGANRLQTRGDFGVDSQAGFCDALDRSKRPTGLEPGNKKERQYEK